MRRAMREQVHIRGRTTVPEKVIIIGSGPAAWTAAIYAARAELQPLVFEGGHDRGKPPGRHPARWAN